MHYVNSVVQKTFQLNDIAVITKLYNDLAAVGKF